MLCPRCDVALENVRLMTGHAALACPQCDGLWTEPDSFRAVAEALIPGSRRPEIASRTDAAATLACVSCGRPMAKVSVGEAAVDWCRPHGAWFDFGELQQVLGALAEASKRES